MPARATTRRGARRQRVVERLATQQVLHRQLLEARARHDTVAEAHAERFRLRPRGGADVDVHRREGHHATAIGVTEEVRRRRRDDAGDRPPFGDDVNALRRQDLLPPPPTGMNRTWPAAPTLCTRKPTSSMCASMTTRGAGGASRLLGDDAAEAVVGDGRDVGDRLAHDGAHRVLGTGRPRGLRQPTQQFAIARHRVGGGLRTHQGALTSDSGSRKGQRSPERQSLGRQLGSVAEEFDPRRRRTLGSGALTPDRWRRRGSPRRSRCDRGDRTARRESPPRRGVSARGDGDVPFRDRVGEVGATRRVARQHRPRS